MKLSQLRSRVGVAFLALSLLLGIGIVLSSTAQAQNPNDRYSQERDRNNNDTNERGRNWDHYGNYGGSSELRQTALNAGYNEGVREGRADRQNGGAADMHQQSTYQRATTDYNPRLGDRRLYQQYFREAFEDAYNSERYGSANNEGDRNWNRDNNRTNNRQQGRRGRNNDGYGNFGGSFQLRQTALNAGFSEGVKQGRADRNKRNGNNYLDRSVYQKATKDYSSSLGDRSVYQRYFREAYEHGYADGNAGY